MVNEAKEISLNGVRYQLVDVGTEKKIRRRRKKKTKEFKAYGNLYQEDGDKILQLVRDCIRSSNEKWSNSDVVRGILMEYLRLNVDLEKVSKDLITGCYNK